MLNGVIYVKGFNKNDFIIDKVFDKLGKIKKKSSHKFMTDEEFIDEYIRRNCDKECADNLVGSTEVHGPIKIDIVM